MSQSPRYMFRGAMQPPSPPRHPDAPHEPEPYIAEPELVQAVNLAIYLKRPLLLEGEPGCGKTRLARAVAYELGLPFYPWYVRSTSKAQEGLYSYDAIRRLHDVHTFQLEQEPVTDAQAIQKRDPRNPKDYRRLGALGQAFSLPDTTAVVLIDEIDKADIDFPNDLLTVLDDQWSFEIPETRERIVASPEHKPIVIITSNREKGNLPDPFLRRCIYYYVDFPNNPDRLQDIVNSHYQVRQVAPPPDELTESAIKAFLNVRKQGNLTKNPGTSEFLDWLEALHHFEKKPYPSALLSQPDNGLPYHELLFKVHADWLRYHSPS